MKKLLIIFTFFLLLTSCGKKEVNDTENKITENIIIQEEFINSSGKINLSNIEASTGVTQEELAPEIKFKDELSEITDNNFKQIMVSLKKLDKENLKNINCETYFYFPEIDKRPKYQVEIYSDYLKQCNEIIESSKK